MGQLQELKSKNAELEVEFKTTCEVNAELRATLSEAEGIYIGMVLMTTYNSITNDGEFWFRT